MRPQYTLLVILALSSFTLLTGRRTQAKEIPAVPTQHAPASASTEILHPCLELEISSTGAICESPYGVTARLDLPQVDVESVLAGEGYLPSTESLFSANDQVINGAQYRNITFVLRWESTTPAFLQVYLAEILPAWEGKGIPYRLLWRASYGTCPAIRCDNWTQVKGRGEYLPLDIPGLPKELAADSNFNGVPASFWNTNLTVK